MQATETGRTGMLAFIIPAYKSRFLAATLASLAGQTNRNFSVYIGDDASPDDLQEAIEPFRDKLNLYYRRFNDNLGRDSLVRQWERCVAMSNEEFFCILADDDVIDSNCVAGFYAELEESQEAYDVYSFGQAIIDENGKLISYTAASPRTETPQEFLLSRLQLHRISFISSYIIRRVACRRENGFVDFPLAWFSDDASILRFSQLTGIRCIQGPRAYWRLSGRNISSADRNTYWTKVAATIEYLKWFSAHFNIEEASVDRCGRAGNRALVERWFFHNLACYGGYPLRLDQLLRVSAAISPYCESSRVALLFKLHTLPKKKKHEKPPWTNGC